MLLTSTLPEPIARVLRVFEVGSIEPPRVHAVPGAGAPSQRYDVRDEPPSATNSDLRRHALRVRAAGSPPTKTVQVTSTPAGATVRLDGAELGTTPLEVVVSTKGKHVIVVAATGYETATQRIDSAKNGQKLEFTLVDVVLGRLTRELAKAQAAYDKANARLETAQEKSAAAPDSDEKSRALENAEKAMAVASEALEEAEKALNQTMKSRRTDEERAENARKVRAALDRPPPPPSPSTPSKSPGVAAAVVSGGAGLTVFCAWEIPVKSSEVGKEWVKIRNGCFAPPVSAAAATCNGKARAESAEAKPCDCTDDKVVAASCGR